MSYKCKKCDCICDRDWCESCNVTTEIEHDCELECSRIKDFGFGDNGWTTRIEYTYCDECGHFEVN